MGNSENKNEQDLKKRAFIVMPIGQENSEVRRSAEGIYQTVIKPILQDFGYVSYAAHEIDDTGSINKQIIERLLNDDLVVANLTDLNPNVMYELAVRHASRKPIIIVCDKKTKLPFDIIDERTLFFTNDMKGVIELNEPFKRMVRSFENEIKIDNPIYRVARDNLIEKNMDTSGEDYTIYKKLNELEKIILSSISLNRNNSLNSNLDRETKDYYEISFHLEERDFDIVAMEISKIAEECNIFDLKISNGSGDSDECYIKVNSKYNNIRKFRKYLAKMGYETDITAFAL
ncbi:hypothetical protein [Bacillus altitudinis]|uniref:hypothetical protein n=1 Tax=Bacillus altitudinis TaxID=293387 RepID=UPI0011B66127|nr:hypothetical protein [Bacillus altitudinis]QDZ94837.1 hypothetical protein D0438_07775 [Bacillus altitudinis]